MRKIEKILNHEDVQEKVVIINVLRHLSYLLLNDFMEIKFKGD